MFLGGLVPLADTTDPEQLELLLRFLSRSVREFAVRVLWATHGNRTQDCCNPMSPHCGNLRLCIIFPSSSATALTYK